MKMRMRIPNWDTHAQYKTAYQWYGVVREVWGKEWDLLASHCHAPPPPNTMFVVEVTYQSGLLTENDSQTKRWKELQIGELIERQKIHLPYTEL